MSEKSSEENQGVVGKVVLENLPEDDDWTMNDWYRERQADEDLSQIIRSTASLVGEDPSFVASILRTIARKLESSLGD